MVAVQQESGVTLLLALREALQIGRDCDGLLLADSQVSRRHLELAPSGDRVLVTDLDSTNGTFLDGVRITAPVVLLPGSVVKLGGTTIRHAGSSNVGRRTTTTIGATEIEGHEPVPRPGRAQTSIERVFSSVQEEVPDLGGLADDQGTVTIVFSDIESSTALAVAIGDQKWIEVLEHHNRIIEEQVARFGGTIIKGRGDGFMMSFPGARVAIQAMASAQHRLTDLEAEGSDLAVRVRVGLHTGEVISHDGDLHGRHVVLAARIGDAADGGQILVSSLVYELTTSRRDIPFGEPSTHEFKGIDGVHTVYPVDWSSLPR